MSENWSTSMKERNEFEIPDISIFERVVHKNPEMSRVYSDEDPFIEENQLEVSFDESIAPIPVQEFQERQVFVPQFNDLLTEVQQGEFYRIRAVLESGCEIDTQDENGMTPLLIAVKKVTKQRKYLAIVSLLLEFGANPHLKDSDGWSTMDEAVAYQDRELAGILFDHMSTRRLQKWEDVKSLASQALLKLNDFYLEIKWEFTSPIIPFVSSLGPSDVCSMWKSQSSLKLNTSMVGYKRLRCKRRDMSFVFNGSDLVLVNHARKVMCHPLEPVDSEERTAVVNDIMRADPVQGEVSFQNYTISPATNLWGNPKTDRISGYNCVKYNVNLQATLNYRKRARKLDPKTVLEPDRKVNSVKDVKAYIWVSTEFPLSFRYFLPMLALLSSANKTMNKLHEFMSNGTLLSQLPPNSFPVKVEIPLTMSIRAVIVFNNFLMTSPEPAVFELPDYNWESRKVAQKTMSCPRKRMFLANMAV